MMDTSSHRTKIPGADHVQPTFRNVLDSCTKGGLNSSFGLVCGPPAARRPTTSLGMFSRQYEVQSFIGKSTSGQCDWPGRKLT